VEFEGVETREVKVSSKKNKVGIEGLHTKVSLEFRVQQMSHETENVLET